MIKKSNSQAFTLVEVLIAMILMAIIVVGGITFYFNSSRLITLTSHKKLAAEMANSAVEALKESGYSSLTDGSITTNITVGSLSATKTVSISDWSADTPPMGMDYKNVLVTVSWTEPSENSPRTIILKTIIAL